MLLNILQRLGFTGTRASQSAHDERYGHLLAILQSTSERIDQLHRDTYALHEKADLLARDLSAMHEKMDAFGDALPRMFSAEVTAKIENEVDRLDSYLVYHLGQRNGGA
ncbi:hypothetical protein J8J14_19475 [Roseomonas sp. SSH11]|uniref:Uncharacterized protein n=1 Tax=Pararoseomonas baculiformis TaxID=2820812 RepID=A0ABS4AIV5_9PROT|nr:hypothetical protein [Pararoseomonas baculiformis]MBP0446961.1 hypothetical protein [Pararoseomonas baculiformis]